MLKNNKTLHITLVMLLSAFITGNACATKRTFTVQHVGRGRLYGTLTGIGETRISFIDFNFPRRLKKGQTYTFDDANSQGRRFMRLQQPKPKVKQRKTTSRKPSAPRKRQRKHRKHGKKYTSRLFPQFRDPVGDVLGIKKGKTGNFKQREEAFKRSKGRYASLVRKMAGNYRTYSYEELNSLVRQSPLKNLRGGAKGTIRNIRGKSIQQIIAEIQDLSKAAIQSASTTSGLEGGMQKPTSLLRNMQQHAVQGETVATCLLWGDILRKYYSPVVDYLGGVHMFSSKQPDFNKLKIGIQTNTAIAYQADMPNFQKGGGHFSPKMKTRVPHLRRTNDRRRTNQIMAFALNFNKGNLRGKKQAFEDRAKELLRRQYLMTVWAAYQNGIRDVYFTLLGGGAFGNDPQWIHDAIYNNPELAQFIQLTGINVYVVYPTKRQTPQTSPKAGPARPAQLRRPPRRPAPPRPTARAPRRPAPSRPTTRPTRRPATSTKSRKRKIIVPRRKRR